MIGMTRQQNQQKQRLTGLQIVIRVACVMGGIFLLIFGLFIAAGTGVGHAIFFTIFSSIILLFVLMMIGAALQC